MYFKKKKTLVRKVLGERIAYRKRLKLLLKKNRNKAKAFKKK